MSDASARDLPNITCAAFLALSEAEKRAFVIGVANGRGMAAGLFEAYAGAAQDMAASPAEREAIAASYQTIREMMSPLLTVDVASLLNGITAACKRPELRDRLVIEALTSVRVDAAKALRDWREQSR
jgi:citrate lyase alpha subunit